MRSLQRADSLPPREMWSALNSHWSQWEFQGIQYFIGFDSETLGAGKHLGANSAKEVL